MSGLSRVACMALLYILLPGKDMIVHQYRTAHYLSPLGVTESKLCFVVFHRRFVKRYDVQGYHRCIQRKGKSLTMANRLLDIWNLEFRSLPLFLPCLGKIMTSQLEVVEKSAVSGEKHCLTRSHWQLSNMPRLEFQPGS